MTQRTPLIRSVLGSLLAGAVLVAGSIGIANARPDGNCLQRDGMTQTGYHKHGKAKAPFERMLRRLDLSEEQKEQVARIVNERRSDAQVDRAALRKNHKALHELATSSAYDPQRVRALAETQAQLMADKIVARTDTFRRVYQVLTPEQQAQLAELRAQRDAKWEARRNQTAQ